MKGNQTNNQTIKWPQPSEQTYDRKTSFLQHVSVDILTYSVIFMWKLNHCILSSCNFVLRSPGCQFQKDVLKVFILASLGVVFLMLNKDVEKTSFRHIFSRWENTWHMLFTAQNPQTSPNIVFCRINIPYLKLLFIYFQPYKILTLSLFKYIQLELFSAILKHTRTEVLCVVRTHIHVVKVPRGFDACDHSRCNCKGNDSRKN